MEDIEIAPLYRPDLGTLHVEVPDLKYIARSDNLNNPYYNTLSIVA